MSKRSILSRIWHPDPVPAGFAKEGVEIPEQNASFLSRLVFHWITPLLWVGYTRPLEPDDLWSLPEASQAHTVAASLGEQFYSRCPEEIRPVSWRKGSARKYSEKETDADNVEKAQPEVDRQANQSPIIADAATNDSSTEDGKPAASKPVSRFRGLFRRKSITKSSKPAKPNFSRIFFKALHSTLLWRWWIAGLYKLVGDTLQTTSPLVNKALLTWLTEAFVFHAVGSKAGIPPPRGIGYGIGLAVTLFAMQEISSLATTQYQIFTMTNGLRVRAGVISLIFSKSLRLSGRSRNKHSTGQITTLISTDATRLDMASAFIHNLWINPIQIAIGIGLFIGNLGVSGLVGLGVLVIGFPIQGLFVRVMFKQRRKSVKITDQRMRVTTEVLQGIRLIKIFAWEMFYINKLSALRTEEVAAIRKAAMARAGLIALMTAIPVIAAILSFITYALTGHNLSPAVIFSSLQLLNIIRLPLAFIPLVFSVCADAYVALGRIGEFLTAEELEEPYQIETDSKYAVQIDGDFTWETSQQTPGAQKGGSNEKSSAKSVKKGKVKPATVLPVHTASTEEEPAATSPPDERPFELRNLKLKVPKGAFVAIVGRIGSGKSSLLQSLIGEMRRTRGEVIVGGDIAYVPQTAWIMNATLRENVLFGRDDDDAKFQKIVKACSLTQDLEMLPHGDMTEIGEKGINLSGGQKARVSLARAAYAGTDIVLLDDPLSAVDAHVGKNIMEQCLLQGPLADKTRILVTHALHVLSHTDYIFVMENGIITEEGTFHDLMHKGESFARLVDEFGSQEKPAEGTQAPQKQAVADKPKEKSQSTENRPDLMQKEDRNTGQVEMKTYVKYLKAGGGIMWAPFLILLLTLYQSAQVGNNLFLGFWTANSIPGFKQGDYIAAYAGLGIAQAIFSFISAFALSFFCLQSGLALFKAALRGIIRSPISFFDTTPIGRILSRLSKDQDVMDNQLSNQLYQFLSNFSSVIGTIALVFYTFPLLGIIFVPLGVLYWACSVFYRRTSVEAKRLDSVLRSALYASYSETLTGLSTVRAYREQDRFITTSEKALDVENRAYYITIAIQQWLGVRLDLLGNLLLFGIGLFAVGFRTSVEPSKIGVVLSYTLMITQVLSQMVTLYAQTEQNMNSVERVAVYTDLQPEGDTITSKDPPPSWPQAGAIAFRNVNLAYREGLPLVLKDVSFDIKAGEKVGVVGRTGAGKSSLLQALFRIVEVKSGTISIDGVNCREIGLDILRRELAVIPQDSVLFLGTLRDNLDPERSRTDAELISVLRRAWLLPQEGVIDPVAGGKFSLDSIVGDEGSNYSAGERQLLALCRALVKNSKIIVLDEATSSVDVETDSKLQTTIQNEFSTSTLLCIAHRLNTIVYYDRILVMDAGRVVEYDSPLNLFDRTDSIFRSLCDEANLSRQDIVRIRANVVTSPSTLEDSTTQ